MLIRSQATTLLQIFCELLLYSQVIFKIMRVADDTFLWSSGYFLAGSQMVLSMKVISVAFDVSQGALAAPPNLLQYLGYLLHAGSIIFGPWVSYAEYQNVLKQNDRKMVSSKAHNQLR